MALLDKKVALTFVSAAVLINGVNAQNSDYSGCGSWWQFSSCGSNGPDSSFSGNTGGFRFSSLEFSKTSRMLTAHAVMACLVWAFFMPLGGILLRIGIKPPWALRIHIAIQLSSYVMFIGAAGIGIWLVQENSYRGQSLWSDPHPRLGIAILALAFVQPILGQISHLIYKQRETKAEQDLPIRMPGRSGAGRAHMWLGRILIVLGIVNGGLGLQLGYRNPEVSHHTAKVIGYSVAASVWFLIYAFVAVRFELQKKKREKATALKNEEKERSTSEFAVNRRSLSNGRSGDDRSQSSS